MTGDKKKNPRSAKALRGKAARKAPALESLHSLTLLVDIATKQQKTCGLRIKERVGAGAPTRQNDCLVGLISAFTEQVWVNLNARSHRGGDSGLLYIATL